MIQTFQTQLTKDLKNKKVTVIREFDAPPEMVWRTALLQLPGNFNRNSLIVLF